MNIQQLEYALLVQKTASFSRAAFQSKLTQSAISQQIRSLEEEIGFPLFDRQSKPIRPTVDGQLFLEKANEIALGINQLKEFAATLSEEVKGAITVGIIPTLSPYLTPLFIGNLKKEYPDLNLNVREMVTADIIRGLMNRELNAGILATPIKTKLKLQFEAIFYEKFYLYVSPRNTYFNQSELPLELVHDQNLWLLKEGNCFSDQVSNLCGLAPELNETIPIHYTSNSIDSLRRIVDQTDGITFLPELATLNVPAEQEECIKEIEGAPRVREISLVYLKNEPKLHLAQSLVKLIKESVPKKMLTCDKKSLVKAEIVV